MGYKGGKPNTRRSSQHNEQSYATMCVIPCQYWITSAGGSVNTAGTRLGSRGFTMAAKPELALPTGNLPQGGGSKGEVRCCASGSAVHGAPCEPSKTNLSQHALATANTSKRMRATHATKHKPTNKHARAYRANNISRHIQDVHDSERTHPRFQPQPPKPQLWQQQPTLRCHQQQDTP